MLRWLFITFLAVAFAHRLDVDQGDRHCFFEDLQTQDRMTVTYEVGGSTHSGSLDIDFFVVGPGKVQVFKSLGEPQGTWSVTAPSPGRYTYCFSNEAGSGRKTVSFNVHGVMHIDDEEQMAPVEREIRNLASGLQMVKDEQSYLVVRERVHRDTCESTNSRVKWWAIVQIILLLGVCGWNVHYLKSWFEVKRVL
ncbi:hypothetical protein CcaverHIS002_0204940 [Cutaneotrichosporon cavernicola]|uniref:GOLD domain-containing protein n=1 Tax=Cutaneotrichosporon cavernicola TaxID=279322 RepID=A0AA48I3U8_9TREE|nr:uncharacterized protein CcaverHIS019_0204910 [Cutaneotrichosporon cavernicola]BEI81334.1 hypothetical protein CcaverHIS002_0204940 [Cutaneotrichosporon cavernicola]BEI89129.1 hypothetical protein CcaverHIS019_0204910 [Cutaneotrichosporon cavernicola]BEI96906.1 hypothetical protein CcaverHIS631_0204950 [Cutaneotrichosporon cavernicola]BEJ04678.1 hypothetical protein CcaverHIS641_0204950 [Cutaneotrichosporon cavernicola]